MIILKHKIFGKLSDYLINKLNKIGDKQEAKTNDPEVFNNLANIANKNGTIVFQATDKNNPNNNGGYYIGSYKDRKHLDEFVKELREKGIPESEILKKVNLPFSPKLKEPRLDYIVLINSGAQSAGTLAHELGHSYYNGYSKGRSNNIIAKTAHRVVENSMRQECIPKIVNLGSFSTGFLSGYKSAKEKDEKGKSSILTNISGYTVPMIAAAPTLITESAASHKGLKLMKESGANKQMLKNARRGSIAYLGGYAIGNSKPILLAAGGRIAGKVAYKLKNKRKKENDNTET